MKPSQLFALVTGQSISPERAAIVDDLLVIDQSKLANRLAPGPKATTLPPLDRLEQRVAAEVAKGRKAWQIGVDVGIATNEVYAICRERDFPLNKSKKHIDSRDVGQILMLFEGGKTIDEIAYQTSISPDTVKSVVYKKHPLCHR